MPFDPMSLGLEGAGMGLNIAGSLLGEWWASADDSQQKSLLQQAADKYGDASAPNLQKVLAEQLGPSAMQGVQADSGARDARREALSRLMDVGNSGGLDAQSQLANEQARRGAAREEQSQRGAIQQRMAARGMGNSGMALQAQLQAQQGAADRGSMQGMQSASDARSRALQALSQGGEMAGGLERDAYGQDAARAQAADSIARFNAGQRTDAARYNNDMTQQGWQDDMDVRGKQAAGLRSQADYYGNRANRKRNIAGGAGQLLGSGLDSVAKGFAKP